MSMCCRLLLLALFLSIVGTKSTLAEWQYIAPGNGNHNVHRAFAFAEKSDDRLELACNAKRRDLFYSTRQTVSNADLKRLSGGKPAILIRLKGVGMVPLGADKAYQKDGRIIFVTAVTPAFLKDLGKASQRFAVGMRANGKIFQQDLFSADRLQAALKSLAVGCGF